MKLFDYLDTALLQAESRQAYVSKKPAVWPSEASAQLFDKREANIVGKCHRASFFRLIGVPTTNDIDTKAARRFRMGRAMELDVIDLAKGAGVFVACGLRVASTELPLRFELDLVVKDPKTNQLYVVENKSVYGFGGKEVIEKRQPKVEGVMQTCMYLNEIHTCHRLRELLIDAYVEKEALQVELDALKHQDSPEALKRAKELDRILKRNRLEVDLDMLKDVADLPVKAKMAYESRDDCNATEFDISIHEDAIDGLHYPCIDDVPQQLFTIESIYDRFRRLMGYYEKAVAHVDSKLDLFSQMTDEQKVRSKEYWDAFTKELQSLPQDFWPIAEYEWKFNASKIEYLYGEGLLSKTKYNEWKMVASGRNRKPRPLPILGHWQCGYCPFKLKCISVEYPDYSFLAHDLMYAESDQSIPSSGA